MAGPGHLTRQLLALSACALSKAAEVPSDGSDVLLGDGVTVAVVVSCVVSALLILVLIICVCTKTKESKKNGVALVQVTPKPDRRSTTSAEAGDKKDIADSEAVIVHENGTSGHHGDLSPGQSANSDHDAKASSEKRALPQIPQATVPDEIEDDDNYDIIPVSRASAAAAKATPKSPTHSAITADQSSTGDTSSDLYSEVTHDEPNTPAKSKKQAEPPYSKIKDKKNEPPYAKVKSPNSGSSNPYVQVDNVGDPSYAQVTDRPNSGGGDANAAVAPPIPDKRFSGEENAVLTPPGNVVKPASPDLPPRNLFNSDDVDGAVILPPGGDRMDSVPAAGTQSSTVASASGKPGTKREPPYSEVTARESIASIRHREEAERAQRLANPDVLYESVNYEQISNLRSDVDVPVGGADQTDGQMAAISSDLYAEITTSSGDNSNRSSMYAHVPDLRDAHAPTPPPVESLKHLSLHGYSFDPEDSIADPGYSKINKRTTIHRSTLAETAPTEEELGQMYAVVDKSHKRSQSDGSARNVVQVMDVSHLYAQVDKSTKKSPTPGSGAQPRTPSHHEYEGTGARPKIRTNAHFLVGSKSSKNGEKKRKKPTSTSSEISDPAYDTVKDVEENYQTVSADPGYERVRMPGGNSTSVTRDTNGNPQANSNRLSEYDPNYESVNVNDIIQNQPPGGGVNNHTQPSQQAVQISEDPWLKREPLYQEIDEKAQRREEGHRKRKNQPSTVL